MLNAMATESWISWGEGKLLSPDEDRSWTSRSFCVLGRARAAGTVAIMTSDESIWLYRVPNSVSLNLLASDEATVLVLKKGDLTAENKTINTHESYSTVKVDLCIEFSYDDEAFE